MDITTRVSLLPAVATPVATSTEQQTLNRDLIRAVNAVNEAEALGDNYEITFQIDRTSRLPVTRIIDRTTNAVVSQVPAEYILQLADTLGKSAADTLPTLYG
jgi:uncharacterized FlaG/YvyC family protein